MKFERIPKKLFGNDPDETPENNYFESFFKLDLSSRFVFWSEKETGFRDALIGEVYLQS